MNKIYYKITNKDGYYDDHQYIPGLNIADKPLELGYKVRGGLCFTTIEYIFKFLDDGCFLREVTLPKNCRWVHDDNRDKFWADKIILGKRYDLSDPLTFQLLSERGANIHAFSDRALDWASKMVIWISSNI